MSVLKLGLPKGSLEEATFDLFRRGGWRIRSSSRNYFPAVDDIELECPLVRAQEMAKYVEQGTLDCGLTGLDWILEHDAQVEYIADLVYSKVSTQKAKWVLAVPGDSPYHKLEDLAGKRIATELVGFTQRYFAERNIPVDIEFSWGATEGKVVQGLVDAIVEVTETGSTIKAHGLRIIHTLLETNTKFIANRTSWEDGFKRRKIEQIAMLLQGALAAEGMVLLKMNAPQHKVEAVTALLPSLNSPTVSHLYQRDWLSIETVVSETEVRELIPQLRHAGAEGIIELPLNKII